MRYNHALAFISDFKIEKESGNLICQNNIMPDLDMLEKATNKGMIAAFSSNMVM